MQPLQHHVLSGSVLSSVLQKNMVRSKQIIDCKLPLGVSECLKVCVCAWSFVPISVSSHLVTSVSSESTALTRTKVPVAVGNVLDTHEHRLLWRTGALDSQADTEIVSRAAEQISGLQSNHKPVQMKHERIFWYTSLK